MIPLYRPNIPQMRRPDAPASWVTHFLCGAICGAAAMLILVWWHLESFDSSPRQAVPEQQKNPGHQATPRIP